MNAFPSASTVSRALRRDAGIITSRYGYTVQRGLRDIVAPNINVVVFENEARNARLATELAAHLTHLGWEISQPHLDSGILYAKHVPSAAEIAARSQTPQEF